MLRQEVQDLHVTLKVRGVSQPNRGLYIVGSYKYFI